MEILIGAVVGAVIAGVAAWFVVVSKNRAAAAEIATRAAEQQAQLDRVRLECEAAASGLSHQVETFTKQLAEQKTELGTLRTERDGLLQANTRATTQLDEAQKNFAEQKKALEKIQAEMKDVFKAISADALKASNESFLKLAQENFGKHDEKFAGLLKPIRETLGKYEEQTQKIEKSREGAYQSLHDQVKLLTVSQIELRQETQNLVSALQKPQVRGRWGELQLRRVVELAGMANHCDFDEQETSEDGTQRPDMVIHLPGGRDVVVDSKVALAGYLDAVEAKTDEERTAGYQRHARHLAEHVRSLASKAYWEKFDNAPDFVVLFLPGESFLYAALEVKPSLIEDAMNNRVVIATPTTLVALLKAISFGWRQEKIADNAREISALGEELYDRIQTLGAHVTKLGRGIKASGDAYDKMVGSLETRVLPSVRKFRDLGATAKDEIPLLESASIEPRKLTSSELSEPEESQENE